MEEQPPPTASELPMWSSLDSFVPETTAIYNCDHHPDQDYSTVPPSQTSTPTNTKPAHGHNLKRGSW